MARKISFFSQKNSRRAGQSASWIFFSSTHINVVKTTFFPRIVKEGREIRILIRLSSKVISLWQREDSQQKIKEGRGIRILVFFSILLHFPLQTYQYGKENCPQNIRKGTGVRTGALYPPHRVISKRNQYADSGSGPGSGIFSLPGSGSGIQKYDPQSGPSLKRKNKNGIRIRN